MLLSLYISIELEEAYNYTYVCVTVLKYLYISNVLLLRYNMVHNVCVCIALEV